MLAPLDFLVSFLPAELGDAVQRQAGSTGLLQEDEGRLLSQDIALASAALHTVLTLDAYPLKRVLRKLDEFKHPIKHEGYGKATKAITQL